MKKNEDLKPEDLDNILAEFGKPFKYPDDLLTEIVELDLDAIRAEIGKPMQKLSKNQPEGKKSIPPAEGEVDSP